MSPSVFGFGTLPPPPSFSFNFPPFTTPSDLSLGLSRFLLSISSILYVPVTVRFFLFFYISMFSADNRLSPWDSRQQIWSFDRGRSRSRAPGWSLGTI